MPDRETRRTQAQDRIRQQELRDEQMREGLVRTAVRTLEYAHDRAMQQSDLGTDHIFILNVEGEEKKPFWVAVTKCPGAIEALRALHVTGGHKCEVETPPEGEM